MQAHEREHGSAADANERHTDPGPVPMDELLASCAAAEAVSRPPAEGPAAGDAAGGRRDGGTAEAA